MDIYIIFKDILKPEIKEENLVKNPSLKKSERAGLMCAMTKFASDDYTGEMSEGYDIEFWRRLASGG